MCIQRPREVINASALSGSLRFGSIPQPDERSDIMVNGRPIATGSLPTQASRTSSGTRRRTTQSRQAPVGSNGVSDTARRNRSMQTSTRGTSFTDDKVKPSASGSVHVKSFQRGHRRNHSDSSSMFYTRQLSTNHGADTAQARTARSADVSNTSGDLYYRDPSHIDLSLEKCLSSWSNVLHRKQLDHFPYVRLVQVNTGSECNEHVNTRLRALLNISRGLVTSEFANKRFSTGTFALSETNINCIDNISQSNPIEELVLAKHAASYLKEHQFVLSNLAMCWNVLKKSKSRLQRLIGQFLQQPPAVNENFMEVETVNLTFEEVCEPECAVMFSDNSIYFVVIDVEKLSDVNYFTEEGRVRVCLNNIRMMSKKVQVYFVTAKHNLPVDAERAAAERLQELVTSLKQICACGQGLLDVRPNRDTELPLFNTHVHATLLREELFSSLENVVRPVNGSKRFPLLAVKLYHLLKEQRSRVPIKTQTDLSERLRQVCNDIRSTPTHVF